MDRSLDYTGSPVAFLGRKRVGLTAQAFLHLVDTNLHLVEKFLNSDPAISVYLAGRGSFP
jgi:hypothetical protein